MADRKGVADADDFAHKVLDEMRNCSTCAKRPEVASTSSNGFGEVTRKITHACVRQAQSPTVSNNKPKIANKRDSRHVDKACHVDDINFKEKKPTTDGGVNKRRLDEQNEGEDKRRKIMSGGPKDIEATDRTMTEFTCGKCGRHDHRTAGSKKCPKFQPRKRKITCGDKYL